MQVAAALAELSKEEVIVPWDIYDERVKAFHAARQTAIEQALSELTVTHNMNSQPANVPAVPAMTTTTQATQPVQRHSCAACPFIGPTKTHLK